jgi:hypothetical protein
VFGLQYSLTVNGNTLQLNDTDGAYRVNYTGTLKSVLNNICSDLGISFFYFNGTLYFFDLRQGIPITDGPLVTGNGDRITQRRKKKTLQGVKRNVGVGYFGKDCEEKEYSCGGGMCKRLELRLINYTTIFEDYPFHFTGKYKCSDIAGFSGYELEEYVLIHCMLRRLSPDLRDLVVWNNKNFYNFKDGGSKVEEAEEKYLSAYRGWQVVKVFHKDAEDAEAKIGMAPFWIDTFRKKKRVRKSHDLKKAILFLLG